MLVGRTGVRPGSVQVLDGIALLPATRQRDRCGSLSVCGPVGHRGDGVAPEGFALLSVAMPASPFHRMRDEGGAVSEGVHWVDPHKLSVTIEVVDNFETVLATGRFGTDSLWGSTQ